MNIGNFAKKPELIKIEIDTPEVIEVYGDKIDFYIYDSVDINTYFDFFKSQSDQDGDKLASLMRSLILNEKGEKVIAEDSMLPIDLSVGALSAINERLGKSKTKASIPETGNQQD